MLENGHNNHMEVRLHNSVRSLLHAAIAAMVSDPEAMP